MRDLCGTALIVPPWDLDLFRPTASPPFFNSRTRSEMSMPRRKIVIQNVRVFDGNGLTDFRNVVIDGGIIGTSEEGADEVVDGQGGVLMPGFIDAHVHLHHEGHLRQLAEHGVTTALDMATWPADKVNGLRGKTGLTDIRSAGLPATASGSVHSCILPLPQEALLTGPGEAEAWVQRRFSEGSDYIKLISDVPGPSQETLDAVAAAAHTNGKKVVVHASAFTPFAMGLKAQGDVMTHAPRDKPVSSTMIEKMKANNVISVPTLTMMQEVGKTPSLGTILGVLLFKPSLFMAIIRTRLNAQGEQCYDNARESVRMMYEAGVPVLAGTDCHEEPNSPADVRHGSSLHRELTLLVEAGLSTVDTLRAATILPAQHFSLDDRGIVAEGKRADLLLLRENPVDNIQATSSISRVWCGGIDISNVPSPSSTQ